MASESRSAGPLERLRAAGEVQPAAGDINDLLQPIELAAGAELPSATLVRMRRNER